MNTSEAKLQRRSAKQKAEIALRIISGTPREDVENKHGLSCEELESWVETFLEGGREAFKKKTGEASSQAEIGRLHMKIGVLVVENDTLRSKLSGASQNV